MVKKQVSSSGITDNSRGRKAWYYVPLPNEMVGVLDNIVKKHGRKYGQMDKAQLVRALLGFFIEQYEISGGNYIEAILRFRGGEYKETKNKNKDDYGGNTNHSNNNVSSRLLSSYVF